MSSLHSYFKPVIVVTKCVKICIENDDEEEDSVKLSDEQVNELLNNFTGVIMKIITQLSTVEESEEATESERET